MDLAALPTDMRKEICRWLGLPDLAMLQCTCKMFQRDMPDPLLPEIWRTLYMDPLSTWIHRQLILTAMETGPWWLRIVPAVQRNGMDHIAMRFMFTYNGTTCITRINLHMTLNPSPMAFRVFATEKALREY